MKYPSGPLLALILTFNLYSSALFAQPPDPAIDIFRDVTPASFDPTVYDIDSNANAIFLFDRGVVDFQLGSPSYYSYNTVYQRHARLRILRANGLSLATLGISTVRRNNYDGDIQDIRATVYNMEDGQFVVTKLDKSGIFKDKSGQFILDKIAFPNVKVGSIIDYSYRVVYPGYGFIPGWDFQGDYPVLWSQYEVTIPTLFDYFVKTQGYRPFTIDTAVYSQNSFPVAFGMMHGTWAGNVLHRIWALQNMPAMEKREPFTTTVRNHIQKVQFQLSAVRMSGYEKTYHTTWPQLTGELLKNENFGDGITDHNRWMDDQLSRLSPKGDGSLEAAQKLYAFVRDQFSWTGVGNLYLSQPIKKTWEDRKGNSADLNLLLTAVLRHQGFDASPVVLSTRVHGRPIDAFPMLSDYDYVVASVRAGANNYLLDATGNTAGFGQLPERCYNGTAHAIDSSHLLYPLLPDSVTERRTTIVFLDNEDNGDLRGSYRRTMGVFESMAERSRLRKNPPEEFFDNLKKTMSGSKKMLDHGFDSLVLLEKPLGMHYDMSYHFTTNTVYFYPILHERIQTNPLPSPERHYPVEMPYRVDNTYVLRMDVPKGYVVEHLPKSVKYVLEDDGGSYEYLIELEGNAINFRMRLRLNRTDFPVSDYKGLRDFYSMIIEKEKEQIVFKKAG